MDPLAVLLAAAMLLAAFGDKCADDCVCKWKGGKRTVECRDRSLSAVPTGIDPETQVLDASDNRIGALPADIFVIVGLTNLQRLYLRRCRIARIDNDAFAGLTNLVELDLSGNLLSGVPSASFVGTPFLRDLALAGNPLGAVPADAFANTPNLVKLDLSGCQLVEIAAQAFRRLEQLENLKLSDNRLATLRAGTFEPMTKLTTVELQDNPWVCDCHLRRMKVWLVEHNIPTPVSPVCRGGPARVANERFTNLSIDQFACRPVLLGASRYAEATIGDNASIVCAVRATPPARITWHWNNKVLGNNSAFGNFQKSLIFEEGEFDKRSTLVLTNAQESDSSEFYCLAKNPAGSVEANFTLHVSLRTAGMSTLGSGQIAGISAALVVLILFIFLIILVLFVRLRRMPRKEIKSPAVASEVQQVPAGGGGGGGGGGSGGGGNGHAENRTRRKNVDVGGGSLLLLQETTSFSHESKPPSSLSLGYAQRKNCESTGNSRYAIDRFNEDQQEQLQQIQLRHHHHPQSTTSGPCFSSTTSLMPVDNPDLIRDTRRGSTDEIVVTAAPPYVTAEYSRLDIDEGDALYSECPWEARDRVSNATNAYPSKEALAMTTANAEQFPPGAKQMRVWQKGVPVLPPVSSALKRVLGSTRSSPDEGYQEGTGTDV